MAWSIFAFAAIVGTAFASPITRPGATLSESSARAPNGSSPSGGPLDITVSELGASYESDGSFENIGRDGGSGGQINGHNIIIFSDTEVNGVGPITNTLVYTDKGTPQALQDFGSDGIPEQAIPYTANETAYNTNGAGTTRIAIWPQTALIPVGGEDAIGIAPVSIQSNSITGARSGNLYNTLFTVTAGDAPSAKRTVPVLFNAPGVMYGTFNMMLNPFDNKIYYFGADEMSGLKLARSTADAHADVSQWEFYDGQSWNTGASARLTPGASGNIMDGNFSSGNVFWSTKYNTFMIIYMNGFADNKLYYRYIQDGSASVTGEWSDEYLLQDTSDKVNGGYGYNYAGHAYPDFAASDSDLVLSITLSDGLTPFFYTAHMA